MIYDLLPLLAAATIKFWSDLSEGRRLAQQNQLEVARLVAGQLDEVLSGQTESLLALASFRTLDRIQRPLFRQARSLRPKDSSQCHG